MEFINVIDLLIGNGLGAPRLNISLPDANNYKVIMMQPKGYIEANKHGVRNVEADLAREQYSKFFAEASRVQADLAITPEYSCPWEVLLDCIEKTTLPAEGKLWVLGCESLKVSELGEIREKFTPHAEFICEDIPNADENRFLSPLVYVFKAPVLNSSDIKTVILVQFKTCPMADPDHFEINGMQRGRRVYKLGGENNAISLVSLICADSLEFLDDHANEVHRRYLILHIQLNKNPRNSTFRSYRDKIFNKTGDDAEIICLNWASNVRQRDGDNDINWNNISGSAWYLRPDKFDDRDGHLDSNHKKGLYYTWLNCNKYHSLYFNYEPALFLIDATKVYHHSVPAVQSRRRGPKVIAAYRWNEGAKLWEETESLNDGFSEAVKALGNIHESIMQKANASPLAVERILALSSGSVGTEIEWFKPRNVDACNTDQSEVINRITFAQDNGAVEFRNRRISRSQRLLYILQSADIPDAISDFKNGFYFDWSEQKPHQNAVSQAGKHATVAYLGEDATEQDLEKTKSTLAMRLRERASNLDEAIESTQRLIVWHRNNNDEIVIFRPHDYTRYDRSANESPVAFNRES